MIKVKFMGDVIGTFAGMTSIEHKTYVKYVSGWDDIRTIPLECVTLA
jgi:hypothetical protein